MSTVNIEKQEIEILLRSLGGRSLKRSHDSVGGSFRRMIAYIDKIIESEDKKISRAEGQGGIIVSKDITVLIKTYRDMAEKFYTQFELSLLKEINDQSILQTQASQALEYLQNLMDDDSEKEDLKNMIPLFEKARNDAASEYYELTRKFPTILQNALGKLNDEWQRLNTMALASQALEKDEKLIQVLKVVVEAAGFTVGIEAERIAIVPGDTFVLNFFTYLENFAVLTVPIYSVQAPWEWSVFWHELAGYKVRQLKKDTTIKSIKENLENIYRLYNEAKDDAIKESVKSGSLYFESSKKYIGSLFSENTEDKLNLVDLGSFEYQFDRMMQNLLKDNLLKQKGDLLKEHLLDQKGSWHEDDLLRIANFEEYEQIIGQGWCVDWLEELFEDAWSVLVFQKPFLDVFDDILSRHIATDGRHPPKTVRLDVAKELLNLMNEGGDVAKQPKTVEESAAQQIFKLTSLITYAASYKYFEAQAEDPDYIYELLSQVITLSHWLEKISESISDWSNIQVNSADISLDDTDGIIKKITDTQEYATILNFPKKELVPSYQALLDGKDYRQLLALSFFDRDFFNASDITNVEYRKANSIPFVYTKKFDKIQNLDVVFSGSDCWESPQAEIKFTFSGKTYYTDRDKWNKKFENSTAKNFIAP